jgi:hypothetical protein
MNLQLCIEAYFGRLEDEAVQPVLYRDGSSYERLAATWEDERELPTEAALLAYWAEGGEALVQAWEAGQVSAPTTAALQTRIDLLEQALLDAMLGGGV